MPLLTVIAVHYGPPEATRAYARSLADVRGWSERADLVVVDNDGALGGRCEGARVVTPPRNAGYLGGANEALRALEAEALGTWVALSNTDVRLGTGFLGELERLTGPQSALPGEVAMLGPRLQEPQSGDVNPFLVARPSAARILAQRFVFAWPLLGEAYERVHLLRRAATRGESSEASTLRRVYAVHGSFLVMSRAFALHQASVGYEGFLYGEEIHLAELARRRGAAVYHAPSLAASHARAQTLGEVDAAQRMAWRAESRGVLWRSHFAPRGRRSG
jgi:GT2 family glycosyltransferase